MEQAAPSTPSSYWPLRDADALLDALEAGRLDGDPTAVIYAINDRTLTIARNRT